MTTSGPLLVLAGAGSGKTRVITYRITNLIQSGVDPRHILAVTFTNKAAGEMRERAEKLMEGSAKGIWIGTFHSICARLLRMYGDLVGLSKSFVIYDVQDQLSLLKRVLTDEHVSERMFSPKEILWRIDRAKNEGVGPEQFQGDDFFTDMVAKVYPIYERRLLDADATDFGNLLLKVVQMLHQNPELARSLADRFEHVLVDEFQDTNAVQYDLVHMLSEGHGNLCVVGDDDQSIYGWRGADIRNILDFEKDFPDATVVKLEQNYRSTQVILDAATAVIRHNVGRKPKTLWTDKAGGDKITLYTCEDERAEANFTLNKILQLRKQEDRRFGDFAIFYRTHAQSRVIEEALRSARPPVPYAIVGGVRFYDRAEVKNLIAYLKVMVNPADEVSLLRIINVPTRGIGGSTVDKLAAYAREQEISHLESARRCSSGAPGTEGLLRTGPRKKVAGFCKLLDDLNAEAKDLPPSSVAELVLERSGYMERLAIDGTPEAQSRVENLMELVSSLRDYERRSEEPNLVEFLEQVALASDLDGYSESEGQVTLMTVHSAKGLEFPVVFIVGLEQGIFPNGRAIGDHDEMEEEYRLAYVAITRAREKLFLSNARQRWIYGQQQHNEPSEFIRHLPQKLIDAQGISSLTIPRATARPQRRASRATTTSVPQGLPPRAKDEVWVDRSFDQRGSDEGEAEQGFRVGMRVKHVKFGEGEVRGITGVPPNLNLTVFFFRLGSRTIRSQFIQPL